MKGIWYGVILASVIGLAGCAAGAALGILLSLSITELVAALESLLGIQFLKSDVYPVSYLPSDLHARDVLRVCGVALGMSLVATLYPSWRAARMQPADVLRYD